MPTQGRTLREKKRVNYGYDSYDQEIKRAIRAQNSPMKGELNGMGGYDSDSSNKIASNYSPSKYGMRSSRRLNCLRPEAEEQTDVVPVDRNDSPYHENFNVPLSEAEYASNEGEGPLSEMDYEGDERSGSEQSTGLEEEVRPVANAPVSGDSRKDIFSTLIAETNTTVDTSASRRELTSRVDEKSVQVDGVKVSPNQLVENGNSSWSLQNGRKSPAKVGKIAKIEKLRQMHSNPAVFSQMTHPHPALHSTNGNCGEHSNVISEGSRTSMDSVGQDHSEVGSQNDHAKDTTIDNNNEELGSTESRSQYANDDSKGESVQGMQSIKHTPDDYLFYGTENGDYLSESSVDDSGSDYDITADENQHHLSRNLNGQQNVRKSRGAVKKSKYMQDEDFCADEDDLLSDARLSSEDEDFEDDEDDPWRRKSKNKKKGKRRRPPTPEPERVSSRLSGRQRVKYSDDPYADDELAVSEHLEIKRAPPRRSQILLDY